MNEHLLMIPNDEENSDKGKWLVLLKKRMEKKEDSRGQSFTPIWRKSGKVVPTQEYFEWEQRVGTDTALVAG